MRTRDFFLSRRSLIFGILASIAVAPMVSAAVGDQVDQFTVPVLTGFANHCSIGLAFDGTYLYYNICNDTNIYQVNPATGALVDTFDTGLSLYPNALAFDATRNGLWISTQNTDAGSDMPIYFWDFGDDSVMVQFKIRDTLINPATSQSFLGFGFCDGLAFNANSVFTASDDEIWFSDDVNRNIAVFRPDGTFLRGYDAGTVDPSLISNGVTGGNSGLAIGGNKLYLGNNGGGDVFIADANSDPLTLISQFVLGDERQEDMACDQNTFAPTSVMWVRTTPQVQGPVVFPDVITAYEVESGTCGLGGLSTIFADGFESGDVNAWSSSVP